MFQSGYACHQNQTSQSRQSMSVKSVRAIMSAGSFMPVRWCRSSRSVSSPKSVRPVSVIHFGQVIKVNQVNPASQFYQGRQVMSFRPVSSTWTSQPCQYGQPSQSSQTPRQAKSGATLRKKTTKLILRYQKLPPVQDSVKLEFQLVMCIHVSKWQKITNQNKTEYDTEYDVWYPTICDYKSDDARSQNHAWMLRGSNCMQLASFTGKMKYQSTCWTRAWICSVFSRRGSELRCGNGVGVKIVHEHKSPDQKMTCCNESIWTIINQFNEADEILKTPCTHWS